MSNNDVKILERDKLGQVIVDLNENIVCYNNQIERYKNKLKTALDENQVKVVANQLRVLEKNIIINTNSLTNPYFARIDYYDYKDKNDYVLYLGKHGIQNQKSETLTVDWRAPISSAYYDCQLGKNTIETYEGETLDLDLKLKRTIEIENGELIDFYDVDTIANDDLLTKYLAKNKEAVLGEIVATIQKDQNEIIRDAYSHNIIVQGSAGSGKTTVAMHRISFLLYNYKDTFDSNNFYILGSNKMFLNYVTSILPSLDVGEIGNMVLSTFLYSFVAEYLPKKKYHYIDKTTHDNAPDKVIKAKIGFVKALDNFLKRYEIVNIPTNSIMFNEYTIMSRANILNLISTFNDKSMLEKIALLNEQLKKKIVMFKENNVSVYMGNYENELTNHFGDKNKKINIIQIYIEFLEMMKDKFSTNEALNNHVHTIENIICSIKNNNFDIFDLSMLNLIKKRLCTNKKYENVRYIVVDEAQDFGVSIFYTLKNIFTNSYFSIMGDITQNINYEIGMNDWEILKNEVFSASNDKFYILSKSYRNTIEISNFAHKTLKKATFKTYDIEPFLRHGKEVEVINIMSFDDMIQTTLEKIKEIMSREYKTIGIICKTDDEVEKVKEELSKYIDIIDISDGNSDKGFSNGVMIMTVRMSKGLEFDAVILWDVNSKNYELNDENIKLLYVAITRALHELYVLYTDNLTELLEDERV